jgi:hypothetical protein
MDRRIIEANLLALSAANPQLASRLSQKAAQRREAQGRYAFLNSRSGEIVPALNLPQDARPLHSLVDPKHEAQRLVSTIPEDTGFVVFLGLGGGFAPEAALASGARVLVIDFDIDATACLLSAKDYSALFNNERFTLCIDPSQSEIKKTVMEQYMPALCGGIKIMPLRTRTEADLSLFDSAAAAIEEAIKNTAADYSVQAHFGQRWFSNIIRNLKTADEKPESFAAYNCGPIREAAIGEAAIAAAGPSLDMQIPFLSECKSRRVFIISSDTALPVLLRRGIEPDAVVSIDCQHISYHHFLGCNIPRGVPLFLDIASPPLLSRFSTSPLFFCSGHPLALYISQYWRPLPLLDTSGGNVTYACLSLAEKLGAERITLFGADFSYVNSRTYARGTYVYPYFEKKQNRLYPLEALFSSFLYRSPFLPMETNGEKSGEKQNYYETSQLRFYREKLEEKAAMMSALITAAQGQGAPIDLSRKMAHNGGSADFSGVAVKTPDVTPKTAGISAIEFLEQYLCDIAALPKAEGGGYSMRLNIKERQVFTTLLPYAAALKKRNPALKTEDLIEETKLACVREIQRVLAGRGF